MIDGGPIVFVIAVLIVAVLLFIIIKLTAKKSHKFNKEDYQTRFLQIENKLSKDNMSSWPITIINGDKLLDRAMTEMGAPGKTMGERLKNVGDKFTNLDAVWRAHKLRNAIAHESDLEISYKQASNALAIYKQALQDLGAI